MSKNNRRKKTPESEAPTALIAPSDYEHIFSSKEENKKVPPKPSKVPSDAPTALIAPSDYEHIFSSKEQVKKKPAQQKISPVPTQQKMTKVPSDTPTALIAPSDYEHIFSSKDRCKKVPAEVPSDAPTALIAPSDYQHIYTTKEEPRGSVSPSPPPQSARDSSALPRRPWSRQPAARGTTASSRRSRQYGPTSQAGEAATDDLNPEVRDRVRSFLRTVPRKYHISEYLLK